MRLISRLWPPRPSRAGTPPAERPARVLFLDDDPVRAVHFLAEHPQAVWVQTAEECIARLAEPWDEVHLDHDLGGEHFVDHSREDCGMEVVRWICLDARAHLRNARFTVHSHNPAASAMMAMQMMANGFSVELRPFGAPAPDPVPDEEVLLPRRPLLALADTVIALFRRGRSSARAGHSYGYTEFRRDGSDSEGPPPERPDFGWTLPQKRAAGGDAPEPNEPNAPAP